MPGKWQRNALSLFLTRYSNIENRKDAEARDIFGSTVCVCRWVM